MADEIPFRPAARTDAPDLAYLHTLASGGIIEYLYSDTVPGLGPAELLAEYLAGDAEPFTWRNCVVADDAGSVVGKLLTYPADDEAKAADDPRIPPERYEILAPVEQLHAPGTWHICALAVRPGHQGRGIGRRFLELADTQARDNGFTEISLHVFEDNLVAVALYESMGYRIAARRAADHPALAQHEGDVLLMRRTIP